MPSPGGRDIAHSQHADAIGCDADADAAALAACASLLHGHTPEAAEVDGVKARLSELRTRECELDGELSEALAVVERVRAKRDAVRAEMASAESELDALVNAPVSGGRDPFEWLPDELIVMIMLMLPFEVLWSGVCERVCLQWARLAKSTPVQRRKRDGRWAAYEAGLIMPRDLEGHTGYVRALAVGLDGKVYSESSDMTIRVWSGDDGTHLQTLVGHKSYVSALVVGLDGNVYSGSGDTTIRAWSGDDGKHLQTLEGHTTTVWALAVGLDGKVYS